MQTRGARSRCRGITRVLRTTSPVLWRSAKRCSTRCGANTHSLSSHGLEHSHTRWDITSDDGLDLHYERRNTDIAFIVKEKGFGNIFDTFVALGGHALSADVVARFRRDLTACRSNGGADQASARGLSRLCLGGGRLSLLKLFRTDLTAAAVRAQVRAPLTARSATASRI